MKKFYSFLILFSISIFPLLAQPTLEWDTRWNGPIYNDEGKIMAVDDDGNVYVAAISDSTTLKDWLIIKYNPQGEVKWTKRVNGTANEDDEPLDIKIDNAGNVYVTGFTTNQRPTYSDRDMYTIKYSPDGIIQWTKLEDEVYTGLKIIFDVFGNVYIAGGDINSIDYSYIYKYSPTGVFKWQTYIGLSNYDDPQTIKKMEFNVFGNLNILVHYNRPSGYYDKSDLVEIEPVNGNTIFEYEWESGSAISMILDKVNGNVYILSQYSNNRWYVYLYTYHSKYSEDFIIDDNSSERSVIDFKMDKFYRLYFLENWDGIPSIWKYDQNGGSGWFEWYQMFGNYDFVPTGLTINPNVDNPDILVVGNTSVGNIYSFKVDNYNSDTLWTKTYDCGNNNPDIANAMVMDDCENLYITGSSSCNGTYKDIKTLKYSTLEAPVISVTGTLPLCLGQQITLSVTLCNGCTYLWSSGQTTHTITVSPAETTTYKVTVTNSSLCTVSSLPKEVIVNPMLTPSVSIIASKTEICAGDNVIFTATPVNGGLNPIYDWYIDGVKKSSGGLNSFSSSTLANGAVVKCIMTSNSSCLTTPLATSNEIQITVNPKLTASVSIQASKLIICAGESVTFTALPVNGGTAPTYKWYGNNILQAETSEQFTVTGLANGSKVYVEMYSNAMCVTPLKATSNSLVITVNPMVTPEVSIAVSSNSVCQGQNVIFTATPVKGGANPTYQWYVNNELQTETTATFSSSSLPTGSNQLFCIMTSSAECVTQTTAVSNFISIAVNPLVVPKAKINASSTAVFYCEEVIFNVTPTNGGITPTYKWFVNSNLVGSGANYKSSTLLNGSKVYCIMTSNANCVSTPTVNSDTITISVFPLPQPEIKLKHDTISVANYSGSQYKYSWYYKGALISNDPYVLCSKNGNGAYYVIVSLNNCTVTSSTVEIDCSTASQDISGINEFIIFPNPTNDRIFIEGRTINSKKYSVALYNMLGVKLDERILNSENYKITAEFDLSTRRSGIYMISIVSPDYKKVFIVEKF